MNKDFICLTSKELEQMQEKIMGKVPKNKARTIDNCVIPSFKLMLNFGDKVDVYDYNLDGNVVEVNAGNGLEYIAKFTKPSVLEADQSTHVVMGLKEGSKPYVRKTLLQPTGTGGQVWENILIPFFVVNEYLLLYEQEDVFQKETRQITETIPSKKHGTSHIVRTYKCYTLKKNWKRAKKRKVEINCPAWGVRGHYRHYASGKVVFIKAYVKGKDKSKYQGKEYKIYENRGQK